MKLLLCLHVYCESVIYLIPYQALNCLVKMLLTAGF